MASNFFSFLGFGKKRSPKKFARDLDDDNDKKHSYPRASKPARKAKKHMMEESPFAGATPATTGSWIACQDLDGNPFWWNDVTGQWTYQLYSTASYAPPMYSYHQYPPQYVLGHQQQQQNQPYLESPSGAHQQSPWGPMVVPGVTGSMFAGPEQQGEGFMNSFNPYYDSVGREAWGVHPTTGQPYPMTS